MSAYEIFSPKQTSKFSKPFRVDVGRVLVISSFNFACAVTDDLGNVTRPADCAILHKIEMGGDKIPDVECGGCGCVLENLDTRILNSEPVVQCGCTWTHNHENNLSVLAVPGYYMFELCNAESVGAVSIKVEEMPVSDAVLIPTSLIHGS